VFYWPLQNVAGKPVLRITLGQAIADENSTFKLRDSEIERSVLRALSLDRKIRSKELCVSCCDGVVTLAGTLRHWASKQAAETASRSAPGVVDVVNTIAIGPLPVVIEQAPLAPSEPLIHRRPATNASAGCFEDAHHLLDVNDAPSGTAQSECLKNTARTIACVRSSMIFQARDLDANFLTICAKMTRAAESNSVGFQ
jgi:hypothetical protein